MDGFAGDLTGVTMAIHVFQTQIGQTDGFCDKVKINPVLSCEVVC